MKSDPNWSFEACDESETTRLGERLAAALEPGTVVGLTGDLGAGKTRLVRAVAVGLGVPAADVTSPTFTLIHEYAGRLPIFHFDTYRLRDEDEFRELGAEEFFESGGVCLVEWADRVRKVLPNDVLWITVETTGMDSRRFHIHGTGPVSARVAARLSAE